MSIYRGAGGSGDAVADSSSEALLVRELAIEVQADADAAAASATSASGSASDAAGSATSAANSATAAASSATAASNSASAASTSATNAANSATAAQTAETNAETAETNAETAETNAETAATNAASSASAASTSATNASNSATSAATSATNASNSASAAATSATNAASSATSASGSATAAASSASSASTSATNAAASATSAAGSATTATTQAGIATTQATNAASSASAASTSATNASNSASAASTSASNASTSATNAANSATSAGTSATNAAASAAAAAASYDSFDDRYLGVKTSAPTVDNDGNALVTGALYYNDGTVTPADKGMWVYDGSQWIAASAASTAILTVFKYTATAAQTTFTGADDNALTLTYTAGSAIITLNGAVLEVGTDVTATTGTSIVLAQAALAGDEVNIYAFATFNIANVYTQAEVDTALALKLNAANPSYTGTLTGGTGVVNLGSGQFYKDASGNIGVGTTSPTSVAGFGSITVNGSGSGSLFDLQTSGTLQARILSLPADLRINQIVSGSLSLYTANTERMRITAAGNIGIGTTNPTANLHISKAGGVIVKFGTSQNTSEIEAREVGASNSLVFSSNNSTDHMVIDGSGNVGIGTASPSTLLHVANTITVVANDSGANAMNIRANSGDTYTQLAFYNNAGTNQNGQIGLEKVGTNGGLMYFKTKPDGSSINQTLTINGNGVLGLFGATTTASGVGIAFPATQSASSNANTLDDYEEGSFTVGSGVSLTKGVGYYIKIGRNVTVFMDVIFPSSALGTSLTLTGLPFTAAAAGAINSLDNGCMSGGFGYISGGAIPQIHLVLGSGNVNFYNINAPITYANVSSVEWRFGFTYIAAD